MIQHTIEGVESFIEASPRILTVRVEGDSVAVPQERKFFVRVTQSGDLMCVPGDLIDLDKGLIEYKNDGEVALKRLGITLTEASNATNKLTDVTRSVSAETNRAAERDLTRSERLFGIKDKAKSCCKTNAALGASYRK